LASIFAWGDIVVVGASIIASLQDGGIAMSWAIVELAFLGQAAVCVGHAQRRLKVTRIVNFCHAAALFFVVWYLMVPPLVDAPSKIDTEAPLTSWKEHRTFNTAEECRKSLTSVQSKYEHTATAPSGTIERGTRAFALQMVFARCISSDDPRLKGNQSTD
jgi:hypothetical protein